jgi:hypothetical protein
MVTIVLSCVIFILSASPDLRHKPAHCDNPVCDNNPDLCPDSIICAPETPKWFKFIELACILVFSIEYFLRVGTVATVPLRLVSPHLASRCSMSAVVYYLMCYIGININILCDLVMCCGVI